MFRGNIEFSFMRSFDYCFFNYFCYFIIYDHDFATFGNDSDELKSVVRKNIVTIEMGGIRFAAIW